MYRRKSHLTKTFVSLHLVLVGILKLSDQFVFRLIVVDVFEDLSRGGILLLQAIQRRLGDIDIAAVVWSEEEEFRLGKDPQIHLQR